jgi:lysophospholipase L1-like esterase
VVARNAIAKAYFEAQRVPINDLHTLMLPHQDLHSDRAHYRPEGYALLSDQVAARVAALLA